MQVHNVQQGTQEWLNLRKGYLTASDATAIGNCGKGLDTLVLKKMSEYYSSGDDKFGNKDTERGNELEPIAADMYELETGNICIIVGFCSIDDYIGCSPDRLIQEDGVVEIKSLNDKNHFEIILEGEKAIPSDYIWQTQMQLLITGRKWNDLIFYNPNFEKSMLIFRQYPNAEKFAALEKGFEIGRAKIKEIKSKIETLK